MEDKFPKRMSCFLDYLGEVIKLGRKVIRNVNSYDDFLLFEHELPRVEGLSLFVRSGDEISWLKVRQQKIEPPPSLPAVIENWVEVYEDPEKEPKVIETRSIAAEGDSEGGAKAIGFYDDEVRTEAFAQYRKTWENWANKTRPKKQAQKLYRELFRIKERLKYDEQIELIWGRGLLVWKYKQYEIRYPIITQRMLINHYAEDGIICVKAPDDIGPKIEFDALTDVEVPDLSHIRKLFEETECDPADPESYISFLKTVAGSISPDVQFFESWEQSQAIASKTPKLLNCWILFVRKRLENPLIRDVQKFKEKLKDPESIKAVPGGIIPFFEEPESKEKSIDTFETHNEWTAFLDKEILFLLPANHEQIQILDRIERSNGVVVQGPPGTGKSHTIVNLISHFMAQGKRVLVTSQKDQALAVLHGMIPDPLKPLCLSVMTYDMDTRRKLEIAVGRITEIVSNSKPNQLRKEIERLSLGIAERKEKITEIANEIKELAGAQFRAIIIENGKAGKAVLPSDLAKRVRQESSQHTWLEDTPPYKIERQFTKDKEVVRIAVEPLSENDMRYLKALRKRLQPYLADLQYVLPRSAKLVDSNKLRQIYGDLKKYRQIETQLEGFSDKLVLKQENSEKLQPAIDALRNGLLCQKRMSDQWQRSLLRKLRESASGIESIREAQQKLLNEKQELESILSAQDPLKKVEFKDLSQIEQLYAFIIDAEQKVKKGKKPYTVFVKKEKKLALKSIKLNGKEPQSEEDWHLISGYAELLLKATNLRAQWNALAELIKAPTLENVASTESVEDLLGLLDRFFAPFEYEEMHRPLIHSELGNILVDTENISKILSPVRIYKALVLRKEQLSFLSAIQSLTVLKDYLIKIQSKKVAHPVTLEMLKCIQTLEKSDWKDDVEHLVIQKWGASYQKIQKLESLDEYFGQFTDLVKKLSLSAPHWAKRWSNPEEDISTLCPENWRKSWFHKALVAYLNDISNDAVKTEVLKKEQGRYELLLRKEKEKLALSKTKLGLIHNISPSCMQSLKGWLLAVKKLGKGTGKWAWKKQKIVQQEMEEAQNAVPVWIMPLYRVSETIPSDFCIFDIVIVDEASQCNEFAFLSLMRAHKVIVVGDPEQISPTAVGIPVEDIDRLKREHLKDIPGWHRYGLTTSLYDLADINFGGQNTLMLREHFRCVPEIIQFSNWLCYHGKILPLRNPPFDQRLNPPLQSVFVESGYREGRQKVNKPEAKAICEKLKELATNTKYKTKTFGVISLVGKDQAKYIHTIIDEYLSPEDQERHQFHVGDSYAFQGDERDVMLLSMVVSGSDDIGLIASIGDVFKQRFNVAASRAKDQMFLFHSARLGVDLKNPEDLKYQLLSFFQTGMQPGVPKPEVKDLFESPFEEAVYDYLSARGYQITPQVRVGDYRIDLVVEGKENRLAVECDGDRWHPPERWWEDRMRQRQLERAGWKFWRVWGSAFFEDPDSAMASIFSSLEDLNIHPISKQAPSEKEPKDKRDEPSADRMETENHQDPDVDQYQSSMENLETGKKAQKTPDKKKPRKSLKAAGRQKSREIGESLIRPSNLVDPLPHIIASILPKKQHKCQECGSKVQVFIGFRGPFLKCTNRSCKKTKSIDMSILNDAFERLGMPCKECGRPMKVAWGPKGPFPGCSGYPECQTSEPWKELRERLKQKDIRQKLGSAK